MGIDINSEFGQMLANMVTQAFEAQAAFEGMNSQLDNLQSSYQTLTEVLESYNKTGYISLDKGMYICNVFESRRGNNAGSSGTGGTDNYNLLKNKPQINGVTLEGNKTLEQLGIESTEDYTIIQGIL